MNKILSRIAESRKTGKKLLWRAALATGTVGAIVAGAAAFSAFEAHVVNVTATIENALTVPQELTGISFGTVFPQEVLHKNLDVTLSASFLAEGRVDDVEYMIRQKPKCGVVVPGTASGSPVSYSSFPQVGEDGPNFVCPEGSEMLPLLCPYLSKHEMTADGTETENDSTGINSFHGPILGWAMSDTLSTQVLGRLAKSVSDTADLWDIDLHVPCFKGQCAQDWSAYVRAANANAIPANYSPDPSLKNKMFGCDLWLEVTEISTTTTTQTGTLTVIKQVINNDGGTATTSDFSLFVDANPVVSGSSTVVTAGVHTVSEGSHVGYSQIFSGDCGVEGLVTVPAGQSRTCIITNDDILVPNGTLIVNKIVVGGNATTTDFSFQVNGGSAIGFEADGQNNVSEPAGNYSVTEPAVAGYVTTYSNSVNANADCANLPVVSLGSVTCTVTNTTSGGVLTVTKVVDNSDGVGTKVISDFPLFVDGHSVTSGVSTTTSPGAHVVSETVDPNYTSVISGDCDASGNVVVPASGSASCTVTNTAKFGTITVTKTVTNNNGGNKVIADFSLFVGSTGVTSGVSKNFAPGTYALSENGLFGYAASFGGDCDISGNVTIAAGQSKSCTINNDDIPPSITLIKSVVGGTNVPDDFDPSIDHVVKTSGSSNQVIANSPHIIDEEATVSGYSFTSITGSSFLGVPCPGSLEGTITLVPGDVVTCTITNTHN